MDLPYIAGHPIFPTADEAVGAIRAGWRQLGVALRSASDVQLEHPVRFWGYGRDRQRRARCCEPAVRNTRAPNR